MNSAQPQRQYRILARGASVPFRAYGSGAAHDRTFGRAIWCILLLVALLLAWGYAASAVEAWR